MRRPSYEASLKNRFINYTEFYRSGGSFTRQRLSRQAGISLLSITLAYTFFAGNTDADAGFALCLRTKIYIFLLARIPPHHC